MKAIVFEINGKEVVLSMEELKLIVGEYFARKNIQTTTSEQNSQYVPQKKDWYKVTPHLISRNLFKNPRKDPWQEQLRCLINDAFEEVDKNPDAPYSKTFYTLVPEKIWNKPVKVYVLQNYACELGDGMASWIEQALEWAERISNGASWQSLCDTVDKSKWYRLIVWKNHKYISVGGSSQNNTLHTKTHLQLHELSQKSHFDETYDTVPVVVKYENNN